MLNTTERPLAAPGWLSYRCASKFGWVMVGAKNDDEAFAEAKRSAPSVSRDGLQKWDGVEYRAISQPQGEIKRNL